MYQRGRAKKIAANAATAKNDKATAAAYTAAAMTDFQAAMANGYPMAFYNVALANENGDNGADNVSKAAGYFIQSANRALECCWTPVARHLLAKESKLDETSVHRVVGQMTLWAAALGNASSSDLLAELAANGTIASTSPLPSAAFTDLPPWLREAAPGSAPRRAVSTQ